MHKKEYLERYIQKQIENLREWREEIPNPDHDQHFGALLEMNYVLQNVFGMKSYELMKLRQECERRFNETFKEGA